MPYLYIFMKNQNLANTILLTMIGELKFPYFSLLLLFFEIAQETPMYQYNAIDQQLVNDRVEQYRDQTKRYLAGELTEEEFLPLRLMNGLYVQRHAPMLRMAIPYGLLATYQ